MATYITYIPIAECYAMRRLLIMLKHMLIHKTATEHILAAQA